MQQGFEKSYSFLLSSLIPRQHLSKERLDGIAEAVALQERGTMVCEAYLAMEELSAKGVFERRGIQRDSDNVSLDYIDRSRKTRLTLEMSVGEWHSLSGAGEQVSEGRGVPTVLSGIISALSLNNSTVSIAYKLQTIIELTADVKAYSKGFLVLDSNLNIPGIHEGENLLEEDITSLAHLPLYGRAIENEKVFVFSKDAQLKKSFFYKKSGSERIILIPLMTEGKNIGVLEVHYPDKTEITREILFNYALIGKGIIRLLKNNIQLEQMVSIDRLTDVNNRNYYENQVPLEIERASRDKKCLAFLIIDIDHFKRFNDEFGHDVGDEVLKKVASTMKNHLRKIDLFIRYGGEEFIAVLPGAESEAAVRTAERLRDVVENTALALEDGRSLRVTVSIGGSIFPVDARNQSELFRHADESLLKAKREGRNRIIFYQA